MTHLKTSTLIIVAIVLGILAVLLLFFVPKTAAITNFDECVAAGHLIMESYPEQCRASDGRTFVNEDQLIGGNYGTSNGCVIAGCSAQLCVPDDEAENIFTTCEFRPEYACYREARCEQQQDGKCEWTQTTELSSCLQNPPALEIDVN